MFVIDVITFSKSAPAGTLSYRSSSKLAPGALVEVPLRKQRVFGIVIRSRSVKEARAELRSASYMLRAGDAKRVGSLPSALMRAAEETARYHAVPLGAALTALLPGVLPEEGFGKLAAGPGFEEFFAESPEKDRMREYADRAGKARAAGNALLLIVPAIVEAERFARNFRESGIPTVLLTSRLRDKKRAAALAAAIAAEGVVVVTPGFAYAPVRNLAGIVLERDSAPGYSSPKRPYLDLRIAARALSRAREVPLILGDYPLRLERRPSPSRALSKDPPGSVTVLDVRKKPTGKKTAFTAVPEAVRAEVRSVLAAGGRAAVFAVRKGYAPAVICRDCGKAVLDGRGRALSLVGTAAGKPVLRSADGETLRDAKALCDACGSWNLLPLGIGVERVALELERDFPTATIVRFDAERVKTPAEARRAMEKIKEPGSILAATESVVPWLAEVPPFEYAAIASADSLLALPFWRARERLLHFGLSLRQHAKHLAVATRLPGDSVFGAITGPSSAAFFEEETALRKTLSYPPYVTLVTFSHEGSKERVAACALLVKEVLAPLLPTELPPRLAAKGRYAATSVLKLPRGAWPDAALSGRLAALPLAVRIRIDPESLW